MGEESNLGVLLDQKDEQRNEHYRNAHALELEIKKAIQVNVLGPIEQVLPKDLMLHFADYQPPGIVRVFFAFGGNVDPLTDEGLRLLRESHTYEWSVQKFNEVMKYEPVVKIIEQLKTQGIKIERYAGEDE